MAALKISKRTVDAAPVPASGDAYYWDTDCKGFGLRVTRNGVKSYVYQFRLKGRPARRVTIGKHGALTAEKAKEAAQALAAEVAKGVDPVEAKRKKARDARTLAFEDYLGRFADECLKIEWPDSWEEAKRTLERHVLKKWKGRAVPELDFGDVRAVLEPIRDQQALARKVWAVLSRFFSFAVEQGDIGASPLVGRRPPPKPKSRKRVLTPNEVVAAWRATYKLDEPWGRFFRLLFATLQRRTEVAGMPWKEVDQPRNLWQIGAVRAKNDEDHLVPLNALAVAELSALGWKRRGFVLSTTGGAKPISAYSKAKAKLDKEMLPILQKLADEEAAALGEDPHAVTLERWTIHDIRRTGTTVMQSLGVAVEVTERVLNHTAGESREGIRGTYNLWKYEPEKRTALHKWGGWLERLVSSDKADVVPLRVAG